MRSIWTRPAPAVLVILLAGGAPTRAAEAPDLLFPLPGTPPLTSSFGEYRSGHYHGGLDLSTGGREGLPVAAPGDGWVLRLRASGIGYGKAVYFRLNDGRTVLFAHLSRFNPTLERAVGDVQDRLGRYEVDFTPERGSLSFGAGEILGYSGSSGAGPPHLHAEIRVGDAAAVAVNPVSQGWAVTDTVAPVMSRLWVEPSRAGVRVNDGVDPVVIDLDDPAPLTVSGPVRLWVETEDRAGEGSYRLAPHTVGAQVAGETLCEVVFDRFNWNWAHEVEWTYHNELARTRGERWVCLEAPPRARQSVARVREPDWTAALTPGEHRLTLFSTDAAGNRSEVAIPFVLEVPASVGGTLAGAGVDRTVLASRGSFLDLRVAVTDSVRVYGVAPDGTRSEAGWTGWPASGGWIYQLEEPSPRVSGLWSFGLNHAGRDSVIGFALWLGGGSDAETRTSMETGDGALRFEAAPAASYGPLWIDLEVATRAEPGAEVSPELVPVGPVVHLGPRAWPLREKITVTLDSESRLPSRKGLAVHSLDGHGWGFEGADTAGVGVSARIRRLGSLALFQDLTPPVVRFGPDAVSARELTAEITDGGVGVVWTGLGMILDGENLVAEWDPEARRLVAHLRTELAPGDHELRVEAADRVGNRSEESMNFSIP